MNRINDCERPSPCDTLVSVVLPVYNEVGVLSVLVQRVEAVFVGREEDFEIVFVDDGSTDGSAELLDRLAEDDPWVRVIHFSRNFGHQAAVQAGLTHCRGDAVVLMDSDMQDEPSAIGEFLREWRSGGDVVYAVHTKRKENPLKKFLFAAFHRLMSRVAVVPVPADAGNFGLIDRRVAAEIAALGETDRYFPGLRSWVGFRQKGIEVERNARYDDRPRVSLGGLIRLAKTAIFSFSSFPLVIFHVIGVLAAATFLFVSGFALYSKLFTAQAIPGWTSHLLTGSFFGALNAMGIAVLGEYVIRIYDQVRRRPAYIVDRTVNLGSDVRVPGEDAASGDEPYMELIQQATQLIQAGTIREVPAVPDAPVDVPAPSQTPPMICDPIDL